jgi:hypothetical protein
VLEAAAQQLRNAEELASAGLRFEDTQLERLVRALVVRRGDVDFAPLLAALQVRCAFEQASQPGANPSAG